MSAAALHHSWTAERLGVAMLLARVTRSLEAIEDGELELARMILDDLANDLRTAVERERLA